MVKIMFPLILLGIIISSCTTSNYSLIVNYYEKNIDLHKKISDSVKILASTCPNGVTFVRAPHNSTTVRCFRRTNVRNVPIYFDSLLKRNDPYPELTSHIMIPIFAISEFNSTIYQGLLADKIGVFFSYRYYDKEREYGLLLYDDEAILVSENIIRKISGNACIYKRFID